MDYESNNKKKPNVETLKYYDNDSEIVNININKYHYAPYLVNITFGLMN